MAGILDFLDALLPSQVAIWFSSLFSYKKFFYTATEISYDDFMELITIYGELKSNLSDMVISNNPNYLLILTVPDAERFVKGQVIGLSDKYKSMFIISDEIFNKLSLPKSINGNYKILLKGPKK